MVHYQTVEFIHDHKMQSPNRVRPGIVHVNSVGHVAQLCLKISNNHNNKY